MTAKQVPTETLRQVLDAFRLWSHNPDGLTVQQELQVNDALNTVKAILDAPSEPELPPLANAQLRAMLDNMGIAQSEPIHSDAFLDQERAGEV